MATATTTTAAAAITTTTTFSKTQRILLLIDLHPFIHLQNPNSYLNYLLPSIKLLLNFTPLLNSIFSFKFFFSNLSPLRSSLSLSNSLHINPHFISFNSPDETLVSLTKAIEWFVSKIGEFGSVSSGPGSKGLNLSSSVMQVIHDYSWDSCDFDCEFDNGFGKIRSNLVVLFSPICQSVNDLCDFMGVGSDLMSDYDCFLSKFRGFFGSVRDAFVSRDVHFSWIDVRFGSNVAKSVENEGLEECGKLVEWFRKGVKSLGWGFCSSDSIVLGSALVSFGLIYPLIGVSWIDWGNNDGIKKVGGELNLEILDVNGNPMECKFCDVQLVDLNVLNGRRLDGISLSGDCKKPASEVVRQSGEILESFGDGVLKIDVKALYKCDNLLKIGAQIVDVVLVSELGIDSKRKKEDSSKEFFADRAIDLLLEESGGFMKRKSPPFWQILLSFMCRNDQCALVDLSNTNGTITRGVLKPFTIHLAILFVLKDSTDGFCETQIGESEQNSEKIAESDYNMDSIGVPKSESRKKHRKHRIKYKDLSWSSFFKAASGLYEMELEEAYFSKGFDTSKKLKFLKCWINQIAKHNACLPVKLETPKNSQNVEERLSQSHQESQQPFPLLVCEQAVKEPPQMKEARASPQEAAEAFFSNLSHRIQHGIASGVDLLAFAQRVVWSSIHWLKQKLVIPDNREESQASLEKSDGNSYGSLVARELVKILLRDPKDIAGKNKDGNLSSKAPDGQLSTVSREDRIREYELQILFRMEILQSEIVAGIRDSAKLKFVKQICRFLEFIQCNMEDGFFGDSNLNDYVGRTIRVRYSQNLGDIVHRIYDQMDLLLFDDAENETPNLLLNSEESSQSWKVGDNDRGSEPHSTDDSFHSGSTTDHDRKLAEARERRARASRFASFSRRAMPELQRVWAPKPPKISRSKSDSFRRSKRKTRNREIYDTVCETPMSGPKKCLFPSDGSVAGKEFGGQGGSSSGSINRALFQDDTLHQDLGL